MENGNTFFKELKCVICLDEKDELINPNSSSHFKCFTCASGYVCKQCMWQFDSQGSIFCEDLDEVREIIKCPCCRVENWNYHYNQIVNITLAYDAVDMYEGQNKAIDYFIKQQLNKDES